MRRLFSIAVLLSLVAACAEPTPPTTPQPQQPPPAETAGAHQDAPPEAATGRGKTQSVSGREYMAVTANPHASRAAAEILARGGTAVDAAIAAQLVLTLVEPQSSGIGGGAFILSYRADQQKLHFYDGRETAPMAVDAQYFMRDDKPRPFLEAVIGGYSVGVPGVMRLLELAHQRDGKLPWADLFAPAIQLAEQGFDVSPRLHQLLVKMPKVNVRPAIAAYFFDPHGQPLPVGHRLKNPAYATTLRTLATEGAESFYSGEIAAAIVDSVRNDPHNPGRMTLEDMAGYQAKVRAPLCSAFLQYRLCGANAPSSGGAAVAEILGVLAHFPLGRLQAGSTELTHLFAEASELAFADRNTYAGDPDFVAVPNQGLVSPAYLKERARLISPDRATPAAAGKPPGFDQSRTSAVSGEIPSTTHLSIVDRYGNGVSMTSSIETAFGSRLLVKGFLLNNQLTDFSFVPTNASGALVANRVQPGKRPRSSMSPTIVFHPDGSMRLLVGSPGGSRIIDYTARTALYHLALDMPIEEAIAAGNIAAIGRNVELEPDAFPDSVMTQLEDMGHRVVRRPLNSGIHAIAIIDGVLHGGADPRREGVAIGR